MKKASRIITRCTAYIECRYLNKEGKKCLVKSGTILLDGAGFDDYSAVVYVNCSDPSDYHVEVSTKTAARGDFDYDYR